MSDKIYISQVRLKPIPATLSGELSDKVFRKCCFCEKNCETPVVQSPLIDKLSGPGNFYCSFCLRHGLNKKSQDVLILSFRSIIGYFYFQNYIQSNIGQKLWISQIEDYIDAHCRAGLVNPLFSYDPDTMLWFINFSKIGRKKKIHIDEVLKTIVSILTSFNLSETTPGVSMSSLFLKYKDAIDGFYRKRFRPADRRMLIPTLANTGVVEPKVCNLDKMRNFIFDDLKSKK